LQRIDSLTDGCLGPQCVTSFASTDIAVPAPPPEVPDLEHVPSGSAEAEPRVDVRARGVSRAWWLAGGALLIGSMILAISVGPVSIHPVALMKSALSHVPFLHVRSSLSPIQEAILWQVRAP